MSTIRILWRCATTPGKPDPNRSSSRASRTATVPTLISTMPTFWRCTHTRGKPDLNSPSSRASAKARVPITISTTRTSRRCATTRSRSGKTGRIQPARRGSKWRRPTAPSTLCANSFARESNQIQLRIQIRRPARRRLRRDRPRRDTIRPSFTATSSATTPACFVIRPRPPRSARR